jgi:O-antigen biosynthesis protein
MHSHSLKPPTVNRELLLAAGLNPPVPMAISAVEHFEPLEAERLQANIAQSQPPAEQHYKAIALTPESRHISGKDNFRLTIDSSVLEKQSSIHVTSCSHFHINGSGNEILLRQNNKFFIKVTDCRDFTIEGLRFSSGRNPLFITGSASFSIKNCQCLDTEGCGVIIHNGRDFSISRCSFDNTLSAGILVIGDSRNGEIRDCTVSRSRGIFNHDAAIHFCHTSPAVTPEHVPERVHEPLPITAKTQRPHHLLIRNCTLTHCRAQGIYLEGALNCLIEDNILLNNNKEGICFDWGSSYNIFRRNIVTLNGERRDTSPLEKKIDFITAYPMLPDGSSSMKLPGLSLDNGCMNLIRENNITGNYGGGIKLIRTALFNTISHNRMRYNTIGANEYVPSFHGITILGLGAKNREFASHSQPLLDFQPSILNTITDNTIAESLKALFHDRGSRNNFVSDNHISQQKGRLTVPATALFRTRAAVKRIAAGLDGGSSSSHGSLAASVLIVLRSLFRKALIRADTLIRKTLRPATCALFRLLAARDWALLRYYPHVVPDDETLKRWQTSEWPAYQDWLDQHSILTSEQWRRQHNLAKKASGKIRISIVTPVFNTDPRILTECILSVRVQTSPFWELILIDDRSANTETLAVLRSGICRDPRIAVIFSDRESPGGISAASNRGIAAARGEFIVFLDHDDRLALEAIQSLINAVENDPALDILYSDRDMISPGGKRFMHLMKPDWSPENLYGGNYIFHLMCYRRELILRAGGLRSAYDGSQDYDLILRCMEFAPRVRHLPQVLYHWRQHAESVAMADDAKSYAFEAGMEALRDALRRRNIQAEVTENESLWRGNYRIALPLPPEEKIGCITVPAAAKPDQYAAVVRESPVLADPPPYIFLQGEECRAADAESVRTLASWLTLENVGMASGCLLDNERKFLYAGMFFTEKGETVTPYAGYDHTEPGYMAITKTARNISAPNPFCVMIRTELWRQLNGFDPRFHTPHALLDFALSALQAQWRIVYVPMAVFTSATSRLKTINSLPEKAMFHQKWESRLVHGDPFYSHNLKKNSNNYELA